MRFLLSALILLFIPSVSPATEVLFSETFDQGFTPAGWSISNIWGDGVWEIDSQTYRSANGSLKLTGDFGNLYLSYDIGEPTADLVFEAWFYDDLSQTLESHVSVTSDPNHLNATGQHLRVGVSCAYDSGSYIAVEGYHSGNSITVGPTRSQGWHRARFVRTGETTYCYFDDTLLLATPFQIGWHYIILNEDSLCTTGSSWFDDVLVTREPFAADPDPLLSTAGSAAVTVFTSPAEGGPSLASQGAVVQVAAVNVLGQPMAGVPAQDVWLESAVLGELALCAGGIQADGSTDALGQTTIGGTIAGGGCVQGGLYAVVQGVPITSSPLPISLISVDMNGDLQVNLADVGRFAEALLGSYNFCADFFQDGQINLADVGVLAVHLGERCQ